MSELDSTLVRELFNYDPETGRLTHKARRKAVKLGRQVGCPDNYGYLVASVTTHGKKRTYKVHRLIWLYVYGTWPEGVIDHINGDRSDNRLSNLRDVSPQRNSQNSLAGRGVSQYRGVCFNKTKNLWQTSIHIDGRQKFVGYYRSEYDAHLAYVEAKRKHHDCPQV